MFTWKSFTSVLNLVRFQNETKTKKVKQNKNPNNDEARTTTQKLGCEAVKELQLNGEKLSLDPHNKIQSRKLLYISIISVLGQSRQERGHL